MTSLRQLVQGERGRFGAAFAVLAVGVALSFVPAFVSGAAIDGLSGGFDPDSAFGRFAAQRPELADLLAGTAWRAALSIVIFTALSGAW